MEEKRRAKRMPAELYLDISSLFKQDNVKVDDIHAPIEVIDVSKSGIGFKTASILPVGYYFNARLILGDELDSCLDCVVQIVRNQLCNDGKYKYGCQFVGHADVLDYIFDDYEKKLELKAAEKGEK